MISWVIPKVVTVPVGSWSESQLGKFFDYANPIYYTVNEVQFVSYSTISMISSSGYNEPASGSATLSSSYLTGSTSVPSTTTTTASVSPFGGGFFSDLFPGFPGFGIPGKSVLTTTTDYSGSSTVPSTTIAYTTTPVMTTTTVSQATTCVLGADMTTMTWSRGETTVFDSYYLATSPYTQGVFFVGDPASLPGVRATSAAGFTCTSYSVEGSVSAVTYSVPVVSNDPASVQSWSYALTQYEAIPESPVAATSSLSFSAYDQLQSFPNSTIQGTTPYFGGWPVTTDWSIDPGTRSWLETGSLSYYRSTSNTRGFSFSTSTSKTILPVWGGFKTYSVPVVMTTSSSIVVPLSVNFSASGVGSDTEGTYLNSYRKGDTRMVLLTPETSSFYSIREQKLFYTGLSYPQQRVAHYSDTGSTAGVTMSAVPPVSGIPISQFGQSGRWAPVLDPEATAFSTTISTTGSSGSALTFTSVSFLTGGATRTLWRGQIGSFGEAGQSAMVAFDQGIFRSAVGSSTGTAIYDATIISNPDPAAAITRFAAAPKASPYFQANRPFPQEIEVATSLPFIQTPPIATFSVTPGY